MSDKDIKDNLLNDFRSLDEAEQGERELRRKRRAGRERLRRRRRRNLIIKSGILIALLVILAVCWRVLLEC